MAAPELGSWEPLPLASVVERFAAAPFRWWMTGGHALELHLGRSWRVHGDVDVGLARRDVASVPTVLAGWDLHVAADGILTPWRGEPLVAERSQNNVWCRRSPSDPWALDLTIGEGDDGAWAYRRDPSVRRPWPEAILRSPAGVPYLAPELQLLFKSKAPRTKDDIDARQVIPMLDAPRRRRLAALLPATHAWQELLGDAAPPR